MQISIDSTPAAAKLQALKQRLEDRVGHAIDAGAARLLALVREKLSGDVLNARSGALRDSIRSETDGLSARVFSEGSVAYARVQEYGGRIAIPGIVPKTAGALSFSLGGRLVFAARTAAHVVRIPQRSYLRSSLAEFAPVFMEDLCKLTAGTAA